MAGRPFFTGFPGFRLSAPFLWNGYAAPPIPAAIFYARTISNAKGSRSEASSGARHLFAKKAGEFSQKTPRTSLLAPIPAVIFYAKYTKRDE